MAIVCLPRFVVAFVRLLVSSLLIQAINSATEIQAIFHTVDPDGKLFTADSDSATG
jgi:hypothetical protein